MGGDQVDNQIVKGAKMSLHHTKRIEILLKAGKKEEARRLHNEYLDAQLEKSKSEPINLSDLIAAKEAFILDEDD
jgi:fatty acid/phospholipid biosynthesis enzyme